MYDNDSYLPFIFGRNQGQKKGRQIGHAQGMEDGYNAGFAAGDVNGWNNAIEECTPEFESLIAERDALVREIENLRLAHEALKANFDSLKRDCLTWREGFYSLKAVVVPYNNALVENNVLTFPVITKIMDKVVELSEGYKNEGILRCMPWDTVKIKETTPQLSNILKSWVIEQKKHTESENDNSPQL